jgi:hypothetical protein
MITTITTALISERRGKKIDNKLASKARLGSLSRERKRAKEKGKQMPRKQKETETLSPTLYTYSKGEKEGV